MHLCLIRHDSSQVVPLSARAQCIATMAGLHAAGALSREVGTMS